MMHVQGYQTNTEVRKHCSL